MGKIITWLSLTVGMAFLSANGLALADTPQQPVNPDAGRVNVPLRPVNLDESQANLGALGFDEQLWGSPDQPGDRQALLKSIDNSLRFLASPKAAEAYRKY